MTLQKSRLFIFFFLFLLLNLAFVPLLSVYGLSVCPVLRVSGFLLGCAYSGVFVGIMYIFNLILTLAQLKYNKTKAWFYPLAYMIATLLALVFLQNFLNIQHASAQSRAPQVLVLASILLGLTQYYGLTWAVGNSSKAGSVLTPIWRKHAIKVMLPSFAMILTLLHFVLTQSRMTREDFASAESIIEGTSILILFLSTWLIFTYVFYFLAEFDAVKSISKQINSIEEQKFLQAKANSGWGLWLFIAQRLEFLGQAMHERSSLVKSFSRFVAKDVVSKATKQEITEVEGEDAELTIIMTDIRDFTKLSDTLPAEKIITILNSYFDMMIDTFVRFEIHIDKFIGDGILAYVESKNDSKLENDRALEACHTIISRLEILNQELTKNQLPPLRIGIGINRGKVVRGLIGSSQRLEHTIIGDPVNRAARLESLCKEHAKTVIINEAIYQNSSSDLNNKFSYLGALKLKGIDEEVRTYGL